MAFFQAAIPVFSMDQLRSTTVSPESWSPGPDFNLGLPKCEAGVLTFLLRCLVKYVSVFNL